MNIKPALSQFRIFITLLMPFCFPLSIYSETQNSYTVIENLAKEPILTPSLKNREILKIRLKNDLEAILVSDPLADLSAAALVVKTGSWKDPEMYPGIAHFLEHMLFLGTKKYPQESGYQKFIAENGGMTNAFTSNDFTGYIFSVNNGAFDEALDRFSNFFKEPLFNPSGVARELQAIDQEYAKNVQNDQIREMYVMKELANPGHPYHEFGMGNSTTLSKVSQSALIDWYQKHYSANLMRLIVYSKLPLNDLKTLVVNDFSDIENKNIEPMATPKVPISLQSNQGKIFYIEPIKNLRNLTLVWNLPEKFANALDTKPDSVVCHVFGDEGEGSLLAELKRLHLAETLGCGSLRLGPGTQAFYLDVDLTEDGIKNVDLVVEKIFQTIAGLKKTGVSQYLFDDVKQIAKNKYRYKNREDMFETVMNDAMKLPYEDIQTFPVQSLIPQKFDIKLVNDLLDFLTPSNAEYFVIAPPSLTGIDPDHTEKWIGAKYAFRSIPESSMERWKNARPAPEITVTKANQFIPKNLEILNKLDSAQDNKIPKPVLISDDSRGKIYFAKDVRFGTPEIYYYFEIKTPKIKSGTATTVVLADLYIKALKDALNKLNYPATVAGLDYEIQRTDNGISITIHGFNDNADLLLKEMFKQLNPLSLPEEKFLIFKESLLREYDNAYKSSPLKAASDMLKLTLYKFYTDEPQKANALKTIDYEAFKNFVSSIFEKTFVEGMMYGNLKDQSATESANVVLNALSSKPYPKNEQQPKLVINLPENKGPFYVEKKVDVQGNAIILALEFNEYSQKIRAAQQILMQAMANPFFATLRTKQQTGYIVDSTNEELERKLFNLFVIQSNTHDPHSLLARIELFIEGYNQELETNISPENFEGVKAALIENLIHSTTNIKSMGEMLKTLAFKYDADFDWMDKRKNGFEELKYEEFLEISKKILGKENKQRVGILVDGLIPKEKTLNYIKLQTIKQLKRLSNYSKL